MKTVKRVSMLFFLLLILTGLIPKVCQAKEDFIIKDGVLSAYVGSKSTITLPSTVTEIGEGVFKDNKTIEKVTIPGSVKKIGDNAFSYCTNLRSVMISKGLKSIGAYAFTNNNNLSQVSIPNTVTLIEDGNFFGSKWFKNFKQDFMIVGDGILLQYKGKASKISLPPSVKIIHSEAFRNYFDKLTQISMNLGLKTIENFSFSYFTKLEKVTIPATVINIGDDAFTCTPWLRDNKNKFLIVGDGILLQYHGKDRKVLLPSSVKTINANAFSENTKISEIVMNDKIAKINAFAFYNCKNLSKLLLPVGVTDIGNYAFSGTGLTSITFLENTKNIGEGAFSGCKKLNNVIFSKSNMTTEIKQSTFSGCTSLQQVMLPQKLSKIDQEAFQGCSTLQAISLPKSLTFLGMNTFSGCKKLKSISMPSTYFKIEYGAFYETEWLKSQKGDFVILKNGVLILYQGKANTVIIPGTVIEIIPGAFENVKMNKIMIPKTVTKIDEDFFDPSKRKEVTVEGGIEVYEYDFQ